MSSEQLFVTSEKPKKNWTCREGTFTGQTKSSPLMTPSMCVDYCSGFAPGTYDWAGVRRNTCYCDKASIDQFPEVPQSDCNFPCPGNTNLFCGGPKKMSVYATSSAQTLTFLETPYYTDGYCCSGNPITDPVSFSSDNMTLEMCFDQCKSADYTYAGLTNGRDCDCGDTADCVKLLKRDCDLPCSGDKDEICGGGSKMSLYKHTET